MWRICGLCGLAIACITVAAAPAAAKLKPHRPVVCKGNREITLVNRVIDAKGDAITLIGNCDLLIKGSHILANGIAIKITGNGDVKIRGSLVRGRRAAVQIMGNGDVYAKNTVFQGKITKVGNGEFHDEGGNKFNKKAGPAPAPADKPEAPAPGKPPGKLKKAAPINCLGSNAIRLVNRHIKTARDAIVIKGSCNITLVGCRIEAGRHGINSMGSGNVLLKNTYLKGGATAITILGSGSVTAKGSEIHGKIRRLGTGSLNDQGGNTIKPR